MKRMMVRSGLSLLMAWCAAGVSHGAPITFNPAVTISATTDVSTAGTAGYAYGWVLGNRTINGVLFQGTNANGNGGVIGGNLSLTNFGAYNSNAFTSATAPYSSLPGTYRGILSGAVYNATANSTGMVTLLNLVSGRQYVVQAWVGDPRTGATTARVETVTSAGGNSQVLKFNATSAGGGVGQFVNGFFTADATTQMFSIIALSSTNVPQLNAIQVRDITGISPYWLGNASAILDNSTTNFSGGQTLPQIKSTYPGVIFADADAATNPVVSTNITVAAGGVVIPTMVFQNSNVVYTFSSADASGLSGATAIQMLTQGGTLILTGTNSFTGNVTVQRGVLNLQNSSALGTSAKTLTVNGLTNGQELAGVQLQGGVTIPAAIAWQTSNSGTNLPAIRSLSGTNFILGGIQITSGGGDTRVIVDTNSVLTLAGAITNISTSRGINLDGAGNGFVTGTIRDNVTNNQVYVWKLGAGNWTLSGSNTYGGVTIVSNGMLVVGANNTLPVGTLLTLGGGTTAGNINLDNFSQTVGSLVCPGTNLLATNIVSIGVLTTNA